MNQRRRLLFTSTLGRIRQGEGGRSQRVLRQLQNSSMVCPVHTTKRWLSIATIHPHPNIEHEAEHSACRVMLSASAIRALTSDSHVALWPGTGRSTVRDRQMRGLQQPQYRDATVCVDRLVFLVFLAFLAAPFALSPRSQSFHRRPRVHVTSSRYMSPLVLSITHLASDTFLVHRISLIAPEVGNIARNDQLAICFLHRVVTNSPGKLPRLPPVQPGRRGRTV